MKKLFLLVISLIGGALTIQSANLSGTYTIGATGTYTNLTAVANLLKASAGNSVTGNCIFELKADYTSAGETFPIVFKQFSATNSSYTVTIRPQTGVASVLTAGSSNTAIISLDSADQYIFDGRAGGSGSAVWTIRNTRSTTAYGPDFRLLNGACSNIITYLIIESQNATTSSGEIYFQGTVNTTGNNNNTVSYCQIRNRSDVAGTYHTNGIYASGNTTYQNSGNIIDHCEFFNHFNAGASTYAIFINTGNTEFTITNNKIYQPSILTFTTGTLQYGIRVNNANGNSFNVSGNIIGYASNSGTGVYTISGGVANRFMPIYLTVGTTIATSVQNNTIAAIELNTTATTASGVGILTGITLTAGKANIGDIFGNTIGDSSSTGSVTVNYTTAGASNALVNGIYSSSTSTVVITNNIIAGITNVGTSAATGTQIKAMLISGTGGNYTIDYNLIGSHNTVNSIQAGVNGSTTSACHISGIETSATGAIVITNNVISNLINYGSGAGFTRMIYSTGGTGTINNNVIKNISTASSSTGTTNASALVGIVQTATSGGNRSINQNQIFNLVCNHTTATNNIVAIYYTGDIAGTNTVNQNFIYKCYASTSSTSSGVYGIIINGGIGTCARNFIHSLSLSASVSNIYGIQSKSGSFTYTNNMIQLGIDYNGASVTANVTIYGIYKSNTSNNYFYFNSVYIGGSGVGTGSSNTSAFVRSSTAIDIVENNIFSNERSNSTTGGKNFAFVINAIATLTSDYNLFNATGTGGVLASINNGTTDRTTLKALREVFNGQELHSGTGDPNFVNPTGNSSAVDLHVSGTTPVESAGIEITGITDDYDGNTRSSITPTDIGADAGSYTTSDVYTPNISYLSLPNTTSTSNRTLSNVSVTDFGTGVPTSGSNVPRIWFRRSSAPATSWASKAGTLSSGSGNDGVWSFEVDYSLLGLTPVSGNVFQYYIVAQDQASSPNIWYEPFSGAYNTNVSTQITPPSTPKSYSITGSGLSGNYNIGTGGDYATLTGSGGFFAAVNSSVVMGDITLTIISNIAETGANSLNEFSESPAGSNFTITIQPDGMTERVLSVNYNGYMVKLNGADRVIIDGNYSGAGKYLRFVNTYTTSATGVLNFLNGACNNTLKNCTLEGGSGENVILIGTAGTSSGNNNNVIDNCTIRNAGSYSILNGINSTGTTTPGLENSNNTIQDCEISNFSQYGIYINGNGNGDDWVIDGNSLYYNYATTPTAATYSPIYFSSTNSNDNQIINNYIGGASAHCGGSYMVYSGIGTFYAINVNVGTTTETVIDNNTIQNIRLSSTSTPKFYGIDLVAGLISCGTTSGNLIGHSTTASSIKIDGTNTVIGISTTSTNAVIKKNTLANIAQSNASPGYFYGIYVTGGYDITVEKNMLFKLGPTSASSTANLVEGIYLYNNSGGSNTYLVDNNMIVLGYGTSNNQTYRGIDYNSTSGSINNIYYNSVVISGTATASTYSSYAFYRRNNGNLNLKNNIFFNERSGSSSSNYAVALTTTTGSIVSNYNLFIVPDLLKTGLYSSTDKTLDTWVTASSQDANSWATSSSDVPSCLLFEDVSTGNLSIINDNDVCWYSNGKGIPLSCVTFDCDDNCRSSCVTNGPTDIGANEFDISGTAEPIVAIQSGIIAVGNTTNYQINSRTMVSISWTNGSDLPTAIDVEYYSGQVPDNPPDGNISVAYFQVTPTGGTDFEYSITLKYDDAILGNISSEPSIILSKTVGVSWSNVSSSVVNTTTKTVTATGLTSFSKFLFLENPSGPLPVSLLGLAAKQIDRKVEVTWTTASESDNSFFTVDKSKDGLSYNTLGKVDGPGNSNSTLFYKIIDQNPASGINYYRLKQTDFNGNEIVYSPVSVNFTGNIEPKITLNNSQSGIGFSIVLDAPSTINFNLIDINGKVLYSEKTSSDKGLVSFNAPVVLSTGIYMVRCEINGQSFIQKFYIQ